MLDQWDAEQAQIRKATLSRAEEDALTQKLKDPGNFAGENGIKDFATDFNKLMANLKNSKPENMH